jgi:hypothetical protein
VHKVTPAKELKEGEDEFRVVTSMCGVGTAGGVMIFDFGVDME